MQAQQLYGALNAVKKESMIRVEADEVTYPLHVILRYAAVQSRLQCCAYHRMSVIIWHQEGNLLLSIGLCVKACLC